MRIEQLTIKDVGGINQLTLPLNPKMNILCGPNGIGKTTILECIAHCFSNGETLVLRRNVNAVNSEINATLIHNAENIPVNIAFSQYEPNEGAQIHGNAVLSGYLLSLKTTRTFVYTPLQSIARDADKPIYAIWQESRTGVNVNDIKNWFVNRYLYSAHAGALSDAQMDNFELAKMCFSALNSDFSFNRVIASTNEILVNSPSGTIYYEFLSSGFKSCLAIFFGIIKEIEFRFAGVRAVDFEGIVLIDEVELHLHPEWQYKIANLLNQIFPMIQFVVTTHSPHVIQSAERDQILALESRDGRVDFRPLPQSTYGFKGWTVDEVLTDVMGMHDTRTQLFNELMNEFTNAIDREDQAAAETAFEKLDSSLHPLSNVRKLLRLQLTSIVSDEQ
ncbi:AAA family ATPase [Pseudomonas sp. TNT3]|uniref:AAA family ATPase n=1 Tax=Pseudomonas sp. TNT3 TaxID=2654097 RepID=UPI0013914C3F|nr:AAA family ATPase [Pseudomonas sp. TNT3]KAI2687475.1 AAA family ATPase [Pseudomonas sp. TNT3]